MRSLTFALLALLAAPGAARAEWLEASSAHFVVYTNDSEQNARTFSEQLERYQKAMSVVTGVTLPDPSPSNRVTVFVVRNIDQVQKLAGNNPNVGGFYIPRAGGALAVVPRGEEHKGELYFGMITLLHEYAHHFLISQSDFPMPRWESESANSRRTAGSRSACRPITARLSSRWHPTLPQPSCSIRSYTRGTTAAEWMPSTARAGCSTIT